MEECIVLPLMVGSITVANGRRRSIYSSRQRMAPGQYETPLADFLDRLPDYFNQYQQNQLALEKQKLQERRYETQVEYQKARDKISDDRYNNTIIRNEKIRQEKIKSDEDKLLFGVGKSYIQDGKYSEAKLFFKENPTIQSSLESIGKKQDTINASLKNIQEMVVNPDISPHEKRIKIDEFKSEYKNDYTLGSSTDTFLNRVDKQVSAEVDRNNAGTWNISEWETRFGVEGRNDARAVKESEEQIEALREKFLETPLVKESFGGDEGIRKSITDQKMIINNIYAKPLYKLETGDEYRERMLTKKAGVKDFGFQSGSISTPMPSITVGTATFPDAGQQLSSDQLAEFESNIDKTMSDLMSDPVVTEESVAEGNKTDVNLPGFVSGVKAGTPPPIERETGQEVKVEPLGTDISTEGEQISENYDIKDISALPSNRLKNPLDSTRYRKDISKINTLLSELEKGVGGGNPEFRIRQLRKGIDKASSEIKNNFGDYINPIDGSFIDKDFDARFFETLSRSSGVPEGRVRQILKGLSTAPVKKLGV